MDIRHPSINILLNNISILIALRRVLISELGQAIQKFTHTKRNVI